MGMTMTQKILANHAGLSAVGAGQLVMAKLDLVLGNDITGPVAIQEFRQAGGNNVFDSDKVVLVADHFTPNKDIRAAQNCKMLRCFAREKKIIHHYDVGEMGIEHCLVPEKGLVHPGDAVIGADSHTCTYGALGAFATGIGSTDMAFGMMHGMTWFRVPSALRFVLSGHPGEWVSGKDVILHIIGLIGVDGALYRSMEFCGPGLSSLSMDDRFTMANMAVEAGAKNGIFEVDAATRDYAAEHGCCGDAVFADDDAVYDREYRIDLGSIRPTVAFPHLPSNTRPVAEAGDVPVDQVVIGSCTNGRISDLRIAARILRGRHVAKGVRTIVLPGSQKIYLQAIREGLLEVFVEAGAVVSTPTCGPCLGGHMGVLAAGERAVSTTNRNFVGRMGHVESEVYLASPAVAAASAVAGRLAEPAEVVGAETAERNA